MKLSSRIRKALGLSVRREPTEPRYVSDQEMSAWLTDRHDPPRSREQIRQKIRKRNPVRWRRMQRDFRWVSRQMRQFGLSPEDARWIL